MRSSRASRRKSSGVKKESKAKGKVSRKSTKRFVARPSSRQRLLNHVINKAKGDSKRKRNLTKGDSKPTQVTDSMDSIWKDASSAISTASIPSDLDSPRRVRNETKHESKVKAAAAKIQKILRNPPRKQAPNSLPDTSPEVIKALSETNFSIKMFRFGPRTTGSGMLAEELLPRLPSMSLATAHTENTKDSMFNFDVLNQKNPDEAIAERLHPGSRVVLGYNPSLGDARGKIGEVMKVWKRNGLYWVKVRLQDSNKVINVKLKDLQPMSPRPDQGQSFAFFADDEEMKGDLSTVSMRNPNHDKMKLSEVTSHNKFLYNSPGGMLPGADSDEEYEYEEDERVFQGKSPQLPLPAQNRSGKRVRFLLPVDTKRRAEQLFRDFSGDGKIRICDLPQKLQEIILQILAKKTGKDAQDLAEETITEKEFMDILASDYAAKIRSLESGAETHESKDVRDELLRALDDMESALPLARSEKRRGYYLFNCLDYDATGVVRLREVREIDDEEKLVYHLISLRPKETINDNSEYALDDFGDALIALKREIGPQEFDKYIDLLEKQLPLSRDERSSAKLIYLAAEVSEDKEILGRCCETYSLDRKLRVELQAGEEGIIQLSDLEDYMLGIKRGYGRVTLQDFIQFTKNRLPAPAMRYALRVLVSGDPTDEEKLIQRESEVKEKLDMLKEQLEGDKAHVEKGKIQNLEEMKLLKERARKVEEDRMSLLKQKTALEEEKRQIEEERERMEEAKKVLTQKQELLNAQREVEQERRRILLEEKRHEHQLEIQAEKARIETEKKYAEEERKRLEAIRLEESERLKKQREDEELRVRTEAEKRLEEIRIENEKRRLEKMKIEEEKRKIEQLQLDEQRKTARLQRAKLEQQRKQLEEQRKAAERRARLRQLQLMEEEKARQLQEEAQKLHPHLKIKNEVFVRIFSFDPSLQNASAARLGKWDISPRLAQHLTKTATRVHMRNPRNPERFSATSRPLAYPLERLAAGRSLNLTTQGKAVTLSEARKGWDASEDILRLLVCESLNRGPNDCDHPISTCIYDPGLSVNGLIVFAEGKRPMISWGTGATDAFELYINVPTPPQDNEDPSLTQDLDPIKLMILQSMGYSRSSAGLALDEAGGDVELALRKLQSSGKARRGLTQAKTLTENNRADDMMSYVSGAMNHHRTPAPVVPMQSNRKGGASSHSRGHYERRLHKWRKNGARVYARAYYMQLKTLESIGKIPYMSFAQFNSHLAQAKRHAKESPSPSLWRAKYDDVHNAVREFLGAFRERRQELREYRRQTVEAGVLCWQMQQVLLQSLKRAPVMTPEQAQEAEDIEREKIKGELHAAILPPKANKLVELTRILLKASEQRRERIDLIVKTYKLPTRFPEGSRVRVFVHEYQTWKEAVVTACWEQGYPYKVRLLGEVGPDIYIFDDTEEDVVESRMQGNVSLSNETPSMRNYPVNGMGYEEKGMNTRRMRTNTTDYMNEGKDFYGEIPQETPQYQEQQYQEQQYQGQQSPHEVPEGDDEDGLAELRLPEDASINPIGGEEGGSLSQLSSFRSQNGAASNGRASGRNARAPAFMDV